MLDDYANRRSSITERYDKLGAALQDAGVKYSILIVTNLMLINAGGLLSLANGAFNSAAAQPDQMLLPASFFVGGLVSALACAYSAYINFNLHAGQQRESQTLELWYLAKERMSAVASSSGIAHDVPAFMSDGRSFTEFVRDSDASVKASQTAFAGRNRMIGLTFWTGQLTGIASAASFVVACATMVSALSNLPQ